MNTTADDNAGQVTAAAGDDELLTAQEAADLWRVDVETIRRHARAYKRSKGKTGLRTIQRKGHAHYRIRKSDLFRYFGGEKPIRRAPRAA